MLNLIADEKEHASFLMLNLIVDEDTALFFFLFFFFDARRLM